jgi:carbon monoxide dehydrogenase subunit G
MQSTHRFTLPAPLEDARNAFRRPDVIATCVPGATIMTADRNEVRGALKIKMGPLPLAYDGRASFTEIDPATPQTLIEVDGADRRGHGTIAGTITASLADEGSGTQVELASDLSVTGRVAQFGEGVIKDAAEKLLEQFATRLAERVAEGVAPPPPEETLVGEQAAEMVAGEAEAAAAAAVADNEPTVILERQRVEADRAQRERAQAPRMEPAASVPPQEADFAVPPRVFARAAQPPREPYVYRPPTNPAEPHVDVLKRIAGPLIKRAGLPLLIVAVIAFVIMRIVRRRQR